MIEGVGAFVFKRRTMGLGIAVEAEMVRIMGGSFVSHGGIVTASRQLADLRVLTAQAPEGWDLEELDPFDDDASEKLTKVWEAFREAEITFLRERREQRAAART